MQQRIRLKPMSVNEAYTGKRFKTKKYSSYKKRLLYELKQVKLPKPPLQLEIVFGFSNSAADWDNPVKPFQDILQHKYKFNDKDIKKGIVEKVIVPKGKEFIDFYISSYNPNTSLLQYKRGQEDLIEHIKNEITKAEKSNNSNDFMIDVLSILKALKPLEKEI